jgi:transposase
MKSNTKRDFRSLSEETQAELRRSAFTKLDRGWTHQQVADDVEVHRETVTRWVKKRKSIEKREYKGMKRGREIYEQRILTKQQEQSIQNAIATKTPDEIGLPYALWNRKAIQLLIQKKAKKKVWLQTVSKYTKRWGFTPQRPAKYATEQDPQKIHHWLTHEYPKIAREALKNKAEIHFADESAISLSTFYQRSYAPIGKTPSIKLPALRGHISFISSISKRGDLRFMMYKTGINGKLFIQFLERLIKDTDTPIYVIVDNLQVHKSKKVHRWAQEHSECIKLFFPTTLRTTVQSR